MKYRLIIFSFAFIISVLLISNYIKGFIGIEIYKNNIILVDKIRSENAFQYMMPDYKFPEDITRLEKETIRLYYRDVYAWFTVLHQFKRYQMLPNQEWETVYGCMKGFIFQNEPTIEYAQMIVEKKRLFNEPFRLLVKEILDSKIERR